jgi:hypothetical protein
MGRAVFQVQKKRLRCRSKKGFRLIGKDVCQVALRVNFFAVLVQIVRPGRITGFAGPMEDVVRSAAQDREPLMEPMVVRPEARIPAQMPLLTVVDLTPVSVLMAVTLTPGILAWLGSCTTPVIDPIA